MPSSVTVSNNFQNKYQVLKERFIKTAEKINFFGITLDLWNNQFTHSTLLAITCQFITENHSLKTLEVNNFVLKNIEI